MKTLLVIVGPTGVGKTELSIRVAQRLGTVIINADSRQVYRSIPIGTAAPTDEEQARVTHYLVGTKNLEEDYNAGQYERDVLSLLDKLFAEHDVVVLTGGSMLYIDAVCNGLDDIPSIPEQIRQSVINDYQREGLAWLQEEVKRVDPDYWEKVDQQNQQRLIHCVEIYRTTGCTYSSMRHNQRAQRAFRIIKIGISRPREELYDRINRRVVKMIASGLEEEAKRVYPQRELNSLQTVGYKEIFGYLDGQYDINRAIELIQQNTRHYAKRQMTWFRRDNDIHWIDANEEYEKQIDTIMDCLSSNQL